jgi:hypothetical protein
MPGFFLTYRVFSGVVKGSKFMEFIDAPGFFQVNEQTRSTYTLSKIPFLSECRSHGRGVCNGEYQRRVYENKFSGTS